MNFIKTYLEESKNIIDQLDENVIEKMVQEIKTLRDRRGRLFFLGVGGSAGHASHAVNDFRKIVGIESYTPTDNVSELTARINDEGWDTAFSNWLKGSYLCEKDMIFVFSVGGGNLEKKISTNIVNALQHAKEVGAKIVGVVGRDGGYTAKVGDAVLVIPTVSADRVTPHTEAFHAVIWHMLVAHPALQQAITKWESTK